MSRSTKIRSSLMTFSLVELGLFAALVLTSGCILFVYFRIRRMGRMLAEYQSAFNATARSLDVALDAVNALNADTRALLAALVERIAEATATLGELTRERERIELARGAPVLRVYDPARDSGRAALPRRNDTSGP
jgi:hypothetical protein